jgi:adenylate cyclase
LKHLETERKFLVNKHIWDRIPKPEGVCISQGYLCADGEKSVRVRAAGDRGFLTIKLGQEGLSRPEYEYPIQMEEALELIGACGQAVVEKVRFRIPAGSHVWEVDEFHGASEGLLMAEIELTDPGEEFECPEWLGPEVTGDQRYYNACLSVHPFGTW